jgi:hypothetical protein
MKPKINIQKANYISVKCYNYNFKLLSEIKNENYFDSINRVFKKIFSNLKDGQKVFIQFTNHTTNEYREFYCRVTSDKFGNNR